MPLSPASVALRPMVSPPSLLMTFALREESRPFRRLVEGRANLAIVETGVGQTNARTALQHALTIFNPRWVITSGYAGALNPKLSCGTVVFEADEALPFTARLRTGGAVAARFHCSERIAVTASEKRRLWETTGADAVEMESQLIRSLCRERGIPSATVRVISDAAAEDLPLDFNQLLTPELGFSYVKLAGALARSPCKLAELVRFRRRVHAAAGKLAQTLAALIGALPA